MNNDQKTALETVVSYALERLREPSTWAGIAVLATSFGFSNENVNRLVTNGPMIVGVIATLIAIFAPSAARRALSAAQDAKSTACNALQTAQAAGPVAGAPQPMAALDPATGRATDSKLLNTNVTVGSNGSLSGARGGQVTLSGLGYSGDLKTSSKE